MAVRAEAPGDLAGSNNGSGEPPEKLSQPR